MKEIFSRLDLIRKYIKLEDHNIIKMQIEKIELMQPNSNIKNILKLLSNQKYDLAEKFIDRYFSKYNKKSSFEDGQTCQYIDVKTLLAEIKALESRFVLLVETRNDCISLLEKFNTMYYSSVGTIVQEILKIKERKYADFIEEKKRAKEFFELEELADNQEKLHTRYDDFCEDVEKIKNGITESNIYNEQRDSCRLDVNDNAAILEMQINDLRDKIFEINEDITHIKSNDTYIYIKSIENLDEYFSDLKQNLQKELDLLSSQDTDE
jgi:hypothetical protein